MTLKGVFQQLKVLHAISFSGVYRAFVVVAVGFFFTEQESQVFSELYLYVMFFTSLIGFPCAAIFMETQKTTRIKVIYGIIVISSIILTCAAYFFYVERELKWLFSVFIATSLSSLLEVYRQNILNRKRYDHFIVVSFLTYAVFLLVSYFNLTSSYYIICLCFLVPCFLSYFLFYQDKIENEYSPRITCIKFTNHSLSSFFSTAVNFILPILMLNELGEASSPDLALVSAIVGLSVFIPRVIANKFILLLQHDLANVSLVGAYAKKISIISVLVGLLVSLFIFFKFEINNLEYMLFAVGVVLSQLSLAYSCVYSVSGRPNVLLEINVYSALFLVLVTFVFSIPFGLNIFVILFSFVFYQFFKLILSMKFISR